MNDNLELLKEIRDFQRRTGMSDSAFGLAVMRDHKLIPDLYDGRDLRLSTVARIREFMKGYEGGDRGPLGKSNPISRAVA